MRRPWTGLEHTYSKFAMSSRDPSNRRSPATFLLRQFGRRAVGDSLLQLPQFADGSSQNMNPLWATRTRCLVAPRWWSKHALAPLSPTAPQLLGVSSRGRCVGARFARPGSSCRRVWIPMDAHGLRFRSSACHAMLDARLSYRVIKLVSAQCCRPCMHNMHTQQRNSFVVLHASRARPSCTCQVT